MEIIISGDYEEMSRKAADALLQIITPIPHPLLCTASGDSPAGLYRELVNRAGVDHRAFSHWKFVGLDEWVGLNGSDEGSCRYHLNNQLFFPLKISQQQIGFFDGRSSNLHEECDRIEEYISNAQGIDVMIAGIGLNGHVGMNEPGSDPAAHSHVSILDPQTKATGQKYFMKDQALTDGLTLGLANFMESRHVFLMVNGKHKAKIIKEVLHSEISNTVPGSLLRSHPSLHVFLDKEAASEL